MVNSKPIIDEEIIANKLKQTELQLIQQEKFAGIGHLAAGVAHEINNPLGFVLSNFETLSSYAKVYKMIIDEYIELKDCLSKNNNPEIQDKLSRIKHLEEENNLEFITEDLDELITDSCEGLDRISKIVTSLRLFSRIDQHNDFEEYEINEGITNTLIIARNEIKYHAEVEENFKDVPNIKAFSSQINQVLLNIIVNAAHAIKYKNSNEFGKITINTYADNEYVYCEIIDTGIGISKENLSSIFDPFFTTKPEGEGTGLGLSICYDIIVNKHGGELLVDSTEGVGTKFTMKLPIKQK